LYRKIIQIYNVARSEGRFEFFYERDDIEGGNISASLYKYWYLLFKLKVGCKMLLLSIICKKFYLINHIVCQLATSSKVREREP
jgi:hypothetical protein